MPYNFDQPIDRRRSESIKWNRYPEDVLPMWVADMDFRAPAPVVRALHERVEHGVFGYGRAPDELREVITYHLAERYDWHVSTEDIFFLSGVVPGFNLACHALASPGQGVLIQTPVYRPILTAPADAGMTNDEMELTRCQDGTYEIDFDLFERTITEQTRIFILCNPHNPVGRVFRPDELERMAEICLSHDVLICSDEIHCDLLLDDNVHTPIASLAPEVAEQTITLMAPSKTYNVAGLKCAVAIVENQAMRKRLTSTYKGLMSGVNVLGYTAAMAAYRHGGPWLDSVLRYLEDNCDLVMEVVEQEMDRVSMARPEGTYLGWLDCRAAGIPDTYGSPYQFFLERAKVALVKGSVFGKGGREFVRLNFGCPRSLLAKGLERMNDALEQLD